MSIDGQDLPQTREAAKRIEQLEEQLVKDEEQYKLLENKLREVEKGLHRDPSSPRTDRRPSRQAGSLPAAT
jgi:hypothetical protein